MKEELLLDVPEAALSIKRGTMDKVSLFETKIADAMEKVMKGEQGMINPIARLGEICRRRGVLFHTDAVQAAGSAAI